MRLPPAFKKDAEAIAEEVRQDLSLSNLELLDPKTLFESLDIPLRSLTELSAADRTVTADIDFLRGQSASALSAFTVFAGPKRAVIYNDAHDPGRQASDLCHEAAHALLMHSPHSATDELGCRVWNQDIEDEASWLGGALLVPGKAARYAAKAGWTFTEMAARFGCSEDMARWRNNESGGQRIRAANVRSA